MPNRVADEGRRSARIVLIGEAPGEREDDAGRPFVGPSGGLLTDWWKLVGLHRSQFYLTNVCPYRPRNNDIETIDKRDMALYTEALHDRLAALEDPWVIVPTGNTALRALTGHTGILKRRGSIYGYRDRAGRTIKTIPTIHPAATFREPSLTRRCIADWRRIAGDLGFRDLRLPHREHYTEPDLDDLRVYAESCDREAESLSLDIETPGGAFVCIGFSYSPEFSITIPTTRSYWGDQYEEAMGWVQHLLASRVDKVMQNGLFDSFYLAWLGYVVNNWQWDTLAMHHALCPNDSHSLEYMASVDTREPYWKDEAKDPQEMKKFGKDLKALWVYNGKDSAVTLELKETYLGRLDARDRRTFYRRHYRDMFEPLLRMSLEGILIDDARREILHGEYLAQCGELLERLSREAGEPLHAKTGLSPIKLKRYLYETLGLPRQRKRGTDTITTDETAIRKLMRLYPERFSVPGRLILDFRRKSKVSQFLAGDIADEDKRVRCEYRFTTETGRLASRGNPRGTGTNLQNQDREVLGLYLPDNGHVLMGLDMSQIEDRWVKVMAYADRAMTRPVECDWEEVLWRARAKPWENDEHWRAAEAIYGLPREEMDKGRHRQIGKRTRHAENYGMGPDKFAEVLSADETYITPAEAKAMMAKLLVADPYIAVYQTTRRMMVAKKRKLENSWGREYFFDYDRLNDETFRRAYAFGPQAEAADLTNQYGVVAGYSYLKSMNARSRLRAQKHDEVLFSVCKEEAWEIYSFVRSQLERPRVYHGVELSVPADLFIGRDWKDKREFKRPPTRDELEGAIEELLCSG